MVWVSWMHFANAKSYANANALAGVDGGTRSLASLLLVKGKGCLGARWVKQATLDFR